MNSVDGPNKIKEWTAVYNKACGRRDIKGKFTREWKKILKKQGEQDNK